MDMSKRLGPWLNGATLHALGDWYEGVILSVEDQSIRNPFTTKTTREPVIVFADGMKAVPTIPMRHELIERFGPETGDWIGQTLVVACRPVERLDAKTGRTSVKYEKYLPPANGGQDEDNVPGLVTRRGW